MKQLSILVGLLVCVSGALALGITMTGEELNTAENDPVFYNELGYHLSELGDLQGAISVFETAVLLDESYETARKNLYVTAFQAGEYALAMEHARYLADSYEDAQYQFDAAQAIVAWVRNDAEDANEALATLEDALAYLDVAGEYPHAAENKVIVQRVLAEFQ